MVSLSVSLLSPAPPEHEDKLFSSSRIPGASYALGEREKEAKKKKSSLVVHQSLSKTETRYSPPPPNKRSIKMGQGQSGGAGFPGQAPGGEKKKEVW